MLVCSLLRYAWFERFDIMMVLILRYGAAHVFSCRLNIGQTVEILRLMSSDPDFRI